MAVSADVCEICKESGLDLHKHHIIPKSRGGDDSPENLVLVCTVCHGKAHDVSFRGNGGLISEGAKRAKKAESLAEEWWQEGMINKLLDSIFEADETLYTFIVSGMCLGLIGKNLLFTITHPSYETKYSPYINVKSEYRWKIRRKYEEIK